PLGRIDGDIWQFAHGSPKYSQLFDELLILPYAASPEEIRAWYELGAPFYDASENVGIDTPEGHVIEIDRRGIIITPAGFPQRGSHLDGRMLGFWDINNVPSIGLGDVRSMAAQLGSNMEYGILMNQGEIRANESVMSIALTNKGVTSDKIEDGSVTFPKLAPLAVALPGKGHVLIYSTQGRRMFSSTTNLQLYSYSFTRQRPDGSVIDTLTIRIRGQVVGWDGPDNTVFGHLTFRI